MLNKFVAALTILLAAAVLATPAVAGLPMRGVNLNKVTAAVSRDDARLPLVAAAGFDHVRLPVDPSFLLDGQGALSPAAVQFLRGQIALIRSRGLQVIVDIHPEGSFKQALVDDESSARAFLRLWRGLAPALADLDNGVYFEILNEPLGSGNVWWERQHEIVRAIREADQKHFIICTAVYGSYGEITKHDPYPEAKVIYAFHFYTPHLFTHQGADWGKSTYRDVHNIPWPMTLGDQLGAYAAHGIAAPAEIGVVNGAAVGREIAKVADWASRRHAVLICDEFGALSKALRDPADRIAYLSDVRRALDQNGIGWTYFSITGGFGIVVPQDGREVMDPATLGALGLRR